MSVSEHAERTGESASRAEAAKVVPGGDETLQKVSGCGALPLPGFVYPEVWFRGHRNKQRGFNDTTSAAEFSEFLKF